MSDTKVFFMSLVAIVLSAIVAITITEVTGQSRPPAVCEGGVLVYSTNQGVVKPVEDSKGNPVSCNFDEKTGGEAK